MKMLFKGNMFPFKCAFKAGTIVIMKMHIETVAKYNTRKKTDNQFKIQYSQLSNDDT